MRNYKIGFDPGALALFLGVMPPNFLWFVVPAANDVLRRASVTPALDRMGSVFQILLIASLCGIRSGDSRRPMKKAQRRGTAALVLLYYALWCLYYGGRIHPAVILGLCAAPCLAFLLFSAARKNGIALLAGTAFTLCHVFSTAANFL